MARVNESTPLLVINDTVRLPPPYRKIVWQVLLAGVLGLGALSLFQHQRAVPLAIADIAVSFNAVRATTDDADDVAFRSSLDLLKDAAIDPCVDFYEYACGNWLKTHDIPSDRPSIDTSFYVVSEKNRVTLQAIIDRNPPQIGPFYHSCLLHDEVDATALAVVTQLVNTVHQVNATLALLELAGTMDQTLGLTTFFSLSVAADPHDATTNVLLLSQGGLTLPSREYYLEQSKVDAYAALYVNYTTNLFAMGDLDYPNVSEFAEAVLKIETAFANISLSSAALRDPWTTNTAYSFAEIAQRYPFVMAYLNGMYKQEPYPMLHAIVATPDFFEAQNHLLSDETLLSQLKEYVTFHLIDSFGSILGEYFRRVRHDFYGKTHGAGDLLPRNEFCMKMTTAFLGNELGKYYMQDVFGPDAKNAAEALVSEIEESLKALLQTEAWLDKVTYDAAVEKLSKVKNYIGGPDSVLPLPFELNADAFFDNVRQLMQLGAARAIQSVGKPVNEKAWDMFPSTVNAYYDPSANKMVFPAAILQPPFYSADHFPAAANFARIGMVMGHELSHGFDDQGRNYDKNGVLRSWWTPSVSAEFAQKAQCLAAQYSTFPVISIDDNSLLGTVNGNLTLGENIADNGGIRLAYEAYHLWRSTFEPVTVVPPSGVSPETSTPNPAAVSPLNKRVPDPAHTFPTDNVPAVTSAPPLLPVPKAASPEAIQNEPHNGIPSEPQPPKVLEPPSRDGPTEAIPQKTTDAPRLPTPADQTPTSSRQESTTKKPAVTSVSPKLPGAPKTPSPPHDSTLPMLPDVPKTPSPPHDSTPSPVPKDVPQPESGVVAPDNTSKDKHKREVNESSVKPKKKDHTEKQKRLEGEDEGEKKDDGEGESSKRGLKAPGDNSHSSRYKGEHHSSKVHEDRKSGNDHHADRNNGDDGKIDRHKHRKHHHHHDHDYDQDSKLKHNEKHRHHGGRHGVRQEEQWKECSNCGRNGYDGKHYKRQEDKDEEHHECRKGDTGCDNKLHDEAFLERKYPFSGGDASLQRMVTKLARAIVQPNDHVADDRLFFTAFAQNWCEKQTPAYAELLRTVDPHSPGKWRVNGPLMNYDKFAEVFACPLGTPMNPAKKCVIW